MVKISVIYEGELHCEATHGPSGNTLGTDAPVDNKGKGETFSPTDLVATALGSCMATIMGQQADTLGIDISGMSIEVEKVMSTDRPRRIVALPVKISMPVAFDEKTAKMMERAAMGCPVHHSVHPDIDVAIDWSWAE